MPVTQEELSALKERVNLVGLIESRGVKLKRRGKSFVGLCPFHEEKNPSFTVNPEERLWHCFGCDKGGDAITFLELKEGLSFSDAADRLREHLSPSASAKPDGRPPSGFNPLQLLERVVEVYHQAFLTDRRGLEYLKKRGITSRELLQAFKVGFSDGSLLKMLPDRGEIIEALKALGILSSSGKEHFSSCVIFPLCNADGHIVNLYGRKIDARSSVRHLYLPGPLKGVFNRQAAKASREVILVEGILDCVTLCQAGFQNVIPLYGVQGLTEDHLALFSSCGVKRIYLALDNDQAGKEAVEKLADRLSSQGLECFSITWPEGVKDANDFFLQHGPPEFKALLKEAVPVGKPPKAASQDNESFSLGALSLRLKPIFASGGKLRVNLRVSSNGKMHLDTIDLYSSRARKSFFKEVEKKFSLSGEAAEGLMKQVIERAEALIKESGEKKEEEKTGAPPLPLTDEEKEEALAFLQNPRLTDEILSDLEGLGYVGEDSAKLLAYFIGVSRKLSEPLSGVILSSSGAGKSCLAEKIEELTPPEEVILYSRLSPQALGYMEKDALKRKLLIIEERVGSEAADYSIRTLQSRRKITQGVVIKDPGSGRMFTRTYVVEGPIAYLETTTRASLNHENATRCFEIYLDETSEQTERIHKAQREQRTLAGLLRDDKSEKIRRKHHNAQRLLTELLVIIPYAPLLTFPPAWLRTRRDNARFLCLIEVIAFLHQHQREKKSARDAGGEEFSYIEATTEDYRLAYRLAAEILGSTLDELPRAARELLEEIQKFVQEEAEKSGQEPSAVTFTRRTIRERLLWPDHKIKEGFRTLQDLEHLEILTSSNGARSLYRLPKELPVRSAVLGGLMTPDELSKAMKIPKRG